jgi:hypothetical protein
MYVVTLIFPVNASILPILTSQCYRSAWLYASSFSTTISTPSADSHIVALQQVLIPNWTSQAFSKFVDATRSLVDELANTTTAHDGKEEMARCEEIFRQICWLEERFWPDVDGMGEEDETARLGAPAFNGPMTQNMGNNINGASGSNFNNTGMGAQINGQMNGPGMPGPSLHNTLNRPQINTNMNNQQLNGANTPDSDGRNTFGTDIEGGIEGVTISS